ncbi:unnamed protein product [Adineta steineri]|uniref:G-protein coupled receptors family 1 profile domain-containing protein n=1 Tax=Adineta steineri TaxID=433720 RepID=A0A813ME16_9BILA|nr:unnamed protein product [Adineta steineri]
MVDIFLITTLVEVILSIVILLFALLYPIPLLLVRRFRHHNNIFIINICLTTLASGIFFLIYFAMYYFDFDRLFAPNMCIVLYYGYNIAGVGIPFAFVNFTIYRFCSIMYPAKGLFKTKRWIVISITIQWISEFVISMPFIFRQEPNNLPSAPMFTKVDYLKLSLNHNWPTYSLRVLSSLINLSYLTKISIETGEASDYDPNLMINICSLLKLTPNVHSLKMTRGMSTRDRDIKTFSLISDHIRHLTVSVSTVTQMSKAIQKVGYRSSIKLYMDTFGDSSKIAIQQFQHENEYYSYRLKRGSLSIWLDKNAYITKQAANQNNIEQTDQDLETFSTFFIPNTK